MNYKTIGKKIQEYIRIKRISKQYTKTSINPKKMILWSFRGRAYSCNPKYITEYIIRNGLLLDYEVVWAFNKPEEYMFLVDKGIKVIKYESNEFYEELMTSHYVITNTRVGFNYHKRNEQIYIQTWHGTMALKSIEKDAQKFLSAHYVANAINDSKKIDYIVSGSKKNTEIIRNSFWYKGKILEIGNPRNDIFFTPNKYKSIVEDKYNIRNKKIVLYAPTFRADGKIDAYDIDFHALIESLTNKYKCDFVILCRLHPNLKGNRIVCENAENVIDVTDYDDMQELLVAADVLITDFSSSMFDFCMMNKKCILYASDYEEYIKNERRLYFDITKDLPFPLAKSNEELISVIENFDEEHYSKRLRMFSDDVIGFIENGNASKQLIDLLKQLG